MDTDAARSFADRCAEAGQRVTDLQERLDGVVRGVAWVGEDHEIFLQRWAARPWPSMAEAASGLEGLAVTLRRDAEEQDEVSSEDSGSGVSTGQGVGGEVFGDIFRGDGDWPEDKSENEKGGIDPAVDQARKWSERIERHMREMLEEIDRPWAEMLADELVDELVADGALDYRAEVEVHNTYVVTGGEAPQDLADLVLDNDETRRDMITVPPSSMDGDKEAQIRIQTVKGEDGRERYIVHVPPTQGAPLVKNYSVFGYDTKIPDVTGTLKGWNEQGQPFGWDNNLYAMAGKENAGANAVKAAMERAGIPEGSEIAFVAHSQGGLVSSQLADDPSFNGGKYQVTDIFSVGSPVQTYTPADPRTDVLNIQHVESDAVDKGDFVPTLDLKGSSLLHPAGNPAPNVRDVEFGTPAPSTGYGDPDLDHQVHDSVLRQPGTNQPDPDSAYYGTVRSHSGDPALAGKTQRMSGKYFGPGTSMSKDIIVDVSRVP